MKALFPTKLLCSAVLLAASSLSTAVSAAVSAANFPYDYFEVRVPLSPGGLGIAGSQQIHPNAHIMLRPKAILKMTGSLAQESDSIHQSTNSPI